MYQLMQELLDKNYSTKVFSGSPGIGKSILMFLVALWQALEHPNVHVRYMRYVENPTEPARIFVDRKSVV